MIQATQLRRGNAIVLNGQVFKVVDHKHITPGNWRGMVQTKLRNLQTGALIDHRFRSEDRVERAILDERAMQYLYSDGEHRYFMDTESFEQIHLSAQTLGDFIQYLTPDCSIRVNSLKESRSESSYRKRSNCRSSRRSPACLPQRLAVS